MNDWNTVLGGNPQAKTPHLKALAAKGITFANAHCAAPACGPSRAAIMSGIRPSTSGNYINNNSLIHNPILNHAVLLPEFFQGHGYRVIGGGKLFHGYHFNAEVKGRGFDDYFPSKTQDLPSFKDLKFSSKLPLGGWARRVDWGPCHPDVTLDDHPDGKTTNWATKQLKDGKLPEPFFLGVGIFQPHLPNFAPREYFDRFPLKDIELPQGFKENDLDDVPKAHAKMAHNPWLKRIRQTGQWKPAIQAYLACTAMVDDLIGQLVRALESSDYADNTIIVLWSDHGYQLGEKKGWSKMKPWLDSARVNLMVSGPRVAQGQTCAKAVSLLDLYPTLMEMFDVSAPPQTLDGNSLMPLLTDPDSKWDKPVLMTSEAEGIRYDVVLSNEYRMTRLATGETELYRLDGDPHEFNNLAGDAKYAGVVNELSRYLSFGHAEPDHHGWLEAEVLPRQTSSDFKERGNFHYPEARAEASGGRVICADLRRFADGQGQLPGTGGAGRGGRRAPTGRRRLGGWGLLASDGSRGR